MTLGKILNLSGLHFLICYKSLVPFLIARGYRELEVPQVRETVLLMSVSPVGLAHRRWSLNVE